MGQIHEILRGIDVALAFHERDIFGCEHLLHVFALHIVHEVIQRLLQRPGAVNLEAVRFQVWLEVRGVKIMDGQLLDCKLLIFQSTSKSQVVGSEACPLPQILRVVLVKEIDPRLRVPGAGIGGFDVPGMGESCFSRDLDIQLDRDVALLWDLEVGRRKATRYTVRGVPILAWWNRLVWLAVVASSLQVHLDFPALLHNLLEPLPTQRENQPNGIHAPRPPTAVPRQRHAVGRHREIGRHRIFIQAKALVLDLGRCQRLP
mmetsp:Transcript_418/g.893  ORF Transcript_418/g.893 Transcript_418/m.893 type:complete len:260 (+) Transcript_418:1162-1941(+)